MLSLEKYNECKNCEKWEKRLQNFEISKLKKTQDEAIFHSCSLISCDGCKIDWNCYVETIETIEFDISNKPAKTIYTEITDHICHDFLSKNGGVWQLRGFSWYIDLCFTGSWKQACNFLKENYEVSLLSMNSDKPKFRIKRN